MGREIRRVLVGWEHPKNDNGRPRPLHGRSYVKAAADFMEIANRDGLQAVIDERGSAPDADDYMPEIPDGADVLLAMYEDTTEGTPISPAFKTPEEVARWCADSGASLFGYDEGTYDQWLRIARGAWAGGLMISNGVAEPMVGQVPA